MSTYRSSSRSLARGGSRPSRLTRDRGGGRAQAVARAVDERKKVGRGGRHRGHRALEREAAAAVSLVTHDRHGRRLAKPRPPTRREKAAVTAGKRHLLSDETFHALNAQGGQGGGRSLSRAQERQEAEGGCRGCRV